ncbi:MAG: excinuclease ABC subunit UvrC [Clostridiales bacterium]|nr:excinuclease ABC subunit UvrC [Clostridiales bacterium]
MFDIQEELKKLPDHPGVYLMHDAGDAIIYIGKAISLRNRVRQYFQSSRNKGPKIEKMVTHIARFEYILTDSELEALVLECNLIKEHRPKYNTMLKDDKTYPYIKVTLGETYPRVLFSRQMKKDKSRYYGPYTSAGAVRDTIELLRKLYQIRSCNRVLPRDIGLERPCLNYHIHQCMAPCQDYISPEEYGEHVRQAMDFLNGKYRTVIEDLENKMAQAAAELDFEKAAEYRDLLTSVKQVAQKQKITSSDGEDRDIIALAMDDRDAVVQVFFVRQGKLIGREHFHVTIGAEDTPREVMSTFIRQYYAGTPFIPREIVLQMEIDDAEVVCRWLSSRRGQKCSIRVPKKGDREKLVELAAQNAQMVLSSDRERIRREEGRTIGAVKEVAALLNLGYISRMEAYDISNTNGFESVGSMVVYEKGKPCRSDYRRFRLRTVAGPDDYASMREVLTRRFTHGIRERQEDRSRELGEEYGSFTRFPDLILMDGGKGQVNIALAVLDELGLDIPVCGMVKDDHHRTRGLYYQNEEISIDTHSEGFALITRIQDEAHRFAIEYHRSLRGKEQVRSVLDDIPLIGTERRKALMRQFQSLEAIRSADVETLAAVPSMNRRAAESVYGFFHPKRNTGVI